jgi:hypothetical protein
MVNTNLNKERRRELIDEYLKLAEIIHEYDDYFLRIKAWGVTLSAASMGIAVSKNSWELLLITIILAATFWITEVYFKLLQLSHMRRAGELEIGLSTDEVSIVGPRILKACSEERSRNKKDKIYLKVMFWNHVMLPHVVFIILAISSIAYLAVTKSI